MRFMFLPRLAAAGTAAALLTTSIVLPAGVTSADEPATNPRSSPSARVASSPLACAPVFFQSAVRDDSSAYQRLYEYSPTTNTFTGLGSNQANAGTQVLGYNTADNYLYELVNYQTSGDDTRMDLVRIDGTSSYSRVNSWSVPSQFNVGDFWNVSSAHYFVVGGDYTNSWRLIDVANDDSRSTQASLAFTIAGSGSSPYFRGKDMTILGNTGYGLHDDTLYVLNLNTRAVSTKAVTFSGGRGTSEGFGSAYADALGNLYFFENSTSQVWRLLAEDIGQATPGLSKVGSGPAYVSGAGSVKVKAPNDGASCPDAPSPYSATISNETATAVTDDTATLTATVDPNGISTTAKICYGTSPQTSGGRLVGCTETAQAANASTGTPLTGISPIALTPIALSSLASRTTYYWQVVTSSSWATTYGIVKSVTTTSVPEVTTSAATGVGTTSATLNGIINPGGRSTTVTFCYGTAADLTGCTTVSASQSPLPASSDDTSVSAAVSGLATGTTYYARTSATNGDGSGSGGIVSFTTSAVPLVSLGAAGDVTSTDARLNAQVNPKGLSTAVSFCWGTSPDLTGCAPVTASQSPLIPVDDSVSASADLTGLTPATTYYMEVSATNSNGTTTSPIGSFTTPAAPLTLSTTTGALPPATVGVAYSKTLTAGGGQAPYSWAIASGTLPVGLTLNSSSGVISGTPAVDGSTSFVARVTDATSATATRTFSISTGAQPTATTYAATTVSGTTATLNGRVDPGNLQTAVTFCYGTDPGLAGCTTVSAAQSPLAASTDDTSVSVSLAGLPMGTTYYARAIATNGAGTAHGPIVTFTTTNVPWVATGSATFLRTSGTVATLNGTVNPNGLSTSVSFCYGTTPTLPGCTPVAATQSPLTASRTISGVSLDVTGLSPSTVYYFTVIATNDLGRTAGSTATFTMPSATASGPTITNLTPTSGSVAGGTSVTITGTNFSTTSKPTVLFDDSAATVTASTSTSITATSPAFAYPGTVDVIVANPDGQADRDVNAFTYTSPVRYSVDYDGNGWTSGTVPTDDSAYPYDDTVVVAAAGTMARSGYDFSGWSTAPSGPGTDYAAGATFRVTGDDTLYARWTPVVIDALSDDTVTFAAQPISSGASAPQVVSLVNEGAASMMVNTIAVAGVDDSDFDVTGGTCSSGDVVTGNASCTIDVTFDPTQVGARLASLQVTTSAGTLTSALTGTGTTAASPGLTPASVSFGSRDVTAGASAAQTVSLANSGGSAMTVTGITLTGSASGDFTRTGGTCGNGGTVAASSSCTIEVAFDPTQVGARSAVLQVTTSAGTVTTGLSGTGTQATPSPQPPINRVPGAPENVSARPGDSAAIVSWVPPSDPGSFPVTRYEVQTTPGGSSCLAEATALQCVVTGLTNGTPYAFRVRALNGVGWSEFSSWSEPVTPDAGPVVAITIVGSRDPNQPRRVLVTGSALQLAGSSVLPHVRLGGQRSYRPGVRTVGVDPTGVFTWQRRTGRALWVYFSGGGARSSSVYIAAQPG